MALEKKMPDSDDYIKIYQANSKNPIKIILSFYKGSGFCIFVSFLAYIIKQAPVWVIPIVTSNIINIVTTPAEHNISEVWVNLVVGILFIAENVLFSFLYARLYYRVIRKIELNLRGALIKKLQQLAISFHKEAHFGKLQSKIMRDVENVELLLNQAYVSLAGIFLDITVAVVIIARKSPMVLLFFAAAIPVAIAIVAGFRKVIENRNREFREEMEETQAAVGEMLEKIPVTRAHGLQKIEIHRMEHRLDKVKVSGYKLDIINNVFAAVGWVVFQIFQLLCLGFTGYLAFCGKIRVGDVVLYQAYFAQIINQVSALTGLFPVISKGLESVRSVGEIITSDEVEEDNEQLPSRSLQGEIEFKDVSYRYKGEETKHALNHFSMRIRKGESVALVGESGSGKSTVLNLLIGFGKVEKGEILIDGIPISQWNMNSFRSQIAIVPQNTILFAGSIRDNISYGLEKVSEEQIQKVIKQVGLSEWVDTLPNGLDTPVGTKGEGILASQKQLISIARALIRNPQVVFFDEATASLDKEAEKRVHDAVSEMMKNRTVIIVTQKLSSNYTVDKVIAMKDGADVKS